MGDVVVDDECSVAGSAVARREGLIRARLGRVLDEYCLSSVGRAVAMAYLGKLSDEDMSRVRAWWLRRLNGKEVVAPAGTPRGQHGCPEIVDGLRARPVWLRGGSEPPPELAWVRSLEDGVDAMREELLALPGTGGFQPYRSPSQSRDYDLATSAGSWNVYYLDLHNVDFAANRARCPRTCSILQALPRAYGHAFFSAASAKTHIAPHHGPTNKKLRCHLPLFCPPSGCRLRVADHTLELVPGKALVFDDSFEHEAWNDHPDQSRLVLVVDVWHPDLSDKEVKFLNFLQTAAMTRDKRLCEAQGASDRSFYSIIDQARALSPDPADIWGPAGAGLHSGGTMT